MKCQTVAQRHNENDQDFVYDNLSRLRAISTRGISTEHFHNRSNFLTISQTFMRRVVARVAVLQKHFPESGRQISFSWRRQSSSEALHREPGNNDPQVFACYVLLVRCDRSRSGWQISGQSNNVRSHPIFFLFLHLGYFLYVSLWSHQLASSSAWPCIRIQNFVPLHTATA